MYFLAFGAMAALMAWLVGANAAYLVAGIGIGSCAVLVAVTFQEIDPVGARIHNGLSGEMYTASELRKLRRHGWRFVPNVHFAAGDVDAVAVGPGGVIVMEVKSYAADWDYLVRIGSTRQWAQQAAQGRLRIKSLIRQHAGHVVEPTALVVGWIRQQPQAPTTLDGGVTAVHGTGLRAYLVSLPPQLGVNEVESIAVALTTAAEQFDRAAGMHNGRLRRRLGSSTNQSGRRTLQTVQHDSQV